MNCGLASRRTFLGQSGLSVAAAAALSRAGHAAEEQAQPLPRGKAEHCIFVWLGGGAGHIDTWDPKRRGDPQAKQAGSYYNAIDTAIPGTQVCEHLRRCASLLDRFNIIRSVHHEVIDEHAAATVRVHTGRPTSGSIIYPSIGSIIAHKRGPAGEGVPAYVLIGYPNVARGPGFLGTSGNFIYLTDTRSGPNGLSAPKELSAERRARRAQMLAAVRQGYLREQRADALVANYDAALEEALRLAGPKFNSIFQLEQEPAAVRESFGGEFGQRCLLARRLVQSGVRFIEVSHNLNFVNGTGWDVHNDGIVNQHGLIQELDVALAGLISDLEAKQLLDKTLIVIATEFGRPAAFDGGGGRGHHAKSFSIVLAGGGLKNGVTIGETDELGMSIVGRPVSIPDLHATIHCALGINPSQELYAGDRPVPITDGGQPIRELFA